MSRVRLLLLGVLTVCALGVVTATSASAGSCTGGTHWVFCNSGGTELANGTPVLGLAGLSLLAARLGGAEIKIDCLDTHLKGSLLPLGGIHGTLLFLACKLIKPATCKLSAKNEVDIAVPFLGELTSGKTAAMRGSGPSEEFVTLEIVEKSGCVIIGNYQVDGKQKVELPKGEESVVEQEVIATKANSELKFGTESASFSSKGTMMLESGEAWLNMFGS